MTSFTVRLHLLRSIGAEAVTVPLMDLALPAELLL
jgi:hypothetical protein